MCDTIRSSLKLFIDVITMKHFTINVLYSFIFSHSTILALLHSLLITFHLKKCIQKYLNIIHLISYLSFGLRELFDNSNRQNLHCHKRYFFHNTANDLQYSMLKKLNVRQTPLLRSTAIFQQS